MKKITGILFFLLMFSVLGCNATQKGAAVGGVAGAGLGAIIGHQSGHTGEGAVIGGAAGAIGGAIIGNQMEQKMFCPVCGKQFDSNVKYCPHDGTELKPVQK